MIGRQVMNGSRVPSQLFAYCDRRAGTVVGLRATYGLGASVSGPPPEALMWRQCGANPGVDKVAGQ